MRKKIKKTSERFDWIITEGNSENDGTEERGKAAYLQ